jgi:hypothetical protein
MNWHFIPLDNRQALALREMAPARKHLAEALLSRGLSQRGVSKAPPGRQHDDSITFSSSRAALSGHANGLPFGRQTENPNPVTDYAWNFPPTTPRTTPSTLTRCRASGTVIGK